MREILFRGKRMDNGEWVEGNLLTSKDGAPDRDFAEILVKDKHGYGVMWYEVDMETICQWTGLVDKNGVKIFEGDLIKTSLCNGVYGVRFINGAFGMLHGVVFQPFSFYLLRGVLFEVIGNIHDKAVE